MTVIEDPEGIESSILHKLVDFKDRRVLEIGCGTGRLTWRYAEKAAHITAIDPVLDDIEAARANLPDLLKERVNFVPSTIDDYARSIDDRSFDIAIFAWSL